MALPIDDSLPFLLYLPSFAQGMSDHLGPCCSGHSGYFNWNPQLPRRNMSLAFPDFSEHYLRKWLFSSLLELSVCPEMLILFLDRVNKTGSQLFGPAYSSAVKVIVPEFTPMRHCTMIGTLARGPAHILCTCAWPGVLPSALFVNGDTRGMRAGFLL